MSSVPAGWTDLAVGTIFQVTAPPGTDIELTRGADSVTGRIEGRGFALTFDYGLYSDPLKANPLHERMNSRKVVINGRAAVIVSDCSPGGSCFSGVHFPEVQPARHGFLQLTVAGKVNNDSMLPVVERIYASIRFAQ